MYSNGLKTENESTKDREDVKGQRNTMLIKKRLVKDYDENSRMHASPCFDYSFRYKVRLQKWFIRKEL